MERRKQSISGRLKTCRHKNSFVFRLRKEFDAFIQLGQRQFDFNLRQGENGVEPFMAA